MFLLLSEWDFVGALGRYDSFIGRFPPVFDSPGPSSLALPSWIYTEATKAAAKFAFFDCGEVFRAA